jgi:hypothetical protein
VQDPDFTPQFRKQLNSFSTPAVTVVLTNTLSSVCLCWYPLAAEWVLKQCKTQMTPQGQVVPLSEDEKSQMLENVVTRMAKVGVTCVGTCVTGVI